MTQTPKTQISIGAIRYGYRPTQTLRNRRIRRAVIITAAVILAAVASAAIMQQAHAHHPEPTATCTPEPTQVPTATTAPTVEPTATVMPEPTQTPAPTMAPTAEATPTATTQPTDEPLPTPEPTIEPTATDPTITTGLIESRTTVEPPTTIPTSSPMPTFIPLPTVPGAPVIATTVADTSSGDKVITIHREAMPAEVFTITQGGDVYHAFEPVDQVPPVTGAEAESDNGLSIGILAALVCIIAVVAMRRRVK